MNQKNDIYTEGNVHKSNEIVEIRNELKILKEELLPERLAKAIDSSYNRIRLFLQILSIMITLFLAGAVSFGIFGVKNIFSIYREATEVHHLSEKVSNDQKEVENSLNSTKEMEGQIDKNIKDFNDTFQKTISDMQSESQKEISDLKVEITNIRQNLDMTSDVFNRVAVKRGDILNTREKQLLVLLAQEITPDNTLFRFNYGQMAMDLGRYDEAIEQFETVLKANDAPSDVIARTKTQIAECKKRKASPPKLTELKGVSIGGYYLLQLHANTLEALRKNGYFTFEQAQKIIDDAREK
ncbi:MAG: tetratricopeptide repeat protein [Sedimentisphaerales bacterium]|nr:tetratricopeptide repeat protein [Sedimentisphaerales bacterium]